MRILVVDDSSVARRLIVRILERDPELHVVGEAVNGQQAVTMAERLRPDVITMDIHMPVMDGLEAIRSIMEQSAVPVVVVTSSASPEDTALSFEAVKAGALTVLEKPKGPGSPEFETQAELLLNAVREMAGIKLVTRRPRRGAVVKQPRSLPHDPTRRIDLVAIAASTGGPAALATVLGALPADMPVPILVVQHISEGFDSGFARWLDTMTPLKVMLAQPRHSLRSGEVVVAPNGRHLGVSPNLQVVLDNSPPMGGHRPSASYLFQSVAKSCGPKALGVILTGMGADGSPGLVQMKSAGGWIIAQDEATSVVYGMPGRSVEAGAVDRVLPLGEIAPEILEVCRRGR
ncbi:MAG: chemotaxis-specific protein-glutamate methyltransferase CheB [Actinobacteria bacterium]|nr:chemotaxis-specific protein-glutamate methyltransferase CheB [Actinomycetota bacterium]